MRQILHDSGELDVGLLDSIVSSVYNASASLHMDQIKDAQDVLSELKSKEGSWRKVDRILEKSESPSTHFFALQILDDAVTKKWNQFSKDDHNAIKTYLWNYIFSIASEVDPGKAKQNKVTLNKANCVLVHILKHEWPENWPNFVSDLNKPMHDPNTQIGLFENTFTIFRLLSEEVFNYESGTMTTRQALRKKEVLCKEYEVIVAMGIEALKACNDLRVVLSALQMMEKYLLWIPSEKVHESPIIEVLGCKFLCNTATRNLTVKCLTEIASKEARTENEKTSMLQMYRGTMSYFSALYPINTPFDESYAKSRQEEADFLYNTSLFLINIFQTNLPLLETNIEESTCGHLYLNELTKIKNKELFKACNEYWLLFCSEIYSSDAFFQEDSPSKRHQTKRKLHSYETVLSEIRKTLTLHMAKPEEIIIVEDDNGELQKEYMTDVETIDLYQTMRQTLVLLTHLDVKDMEEILTANLKKHSYAVEQAFMNPEVTSFNWGEMNTLCWAIGSISGAMSESDERTFFIMVIRELLEMCERSKGKESKAVIASNIMYVVGQYPRFLRSHYRFLKTVANKLTEFMNETFPGVQDMAVDTFLKLARKCGSVLTEGEVDDEETRPPYIQTYMEDLPDILEVLTKPLIYVLYESLGVIVGHAAEEIQETTLIPLLFEFINERWMHSIHSARVNSSLMFEHGFLQEVLFTLKCVTHAGHGLGHSFVHYIHSQLDSLLAMYTQVNNAMEDELKGVTRGTSINYHTIKLFRSVKKEILKVLGEVFSSTNDPESISIHILPYVFNTILPDYAQAQEGLRDAQFLSLLTRIVERLRSNIKDSVPDICECAIHTTLQMISRNMHDFPDLRAQIFKLMRALTRNCFEPFLHCAEKSPLIVEGILWATKHSASEISASGVETLFDFLRQVAHSPIAESFYIAYFITILTEVLAALTDTMHTSDFISHVRIITLLMQIASTSRQIAPDQDPNTKSIDYIRSYLKNALSGAYPNLSEFQIEQFTTNICSLGVGLNDMILIMRDFIIESKEWGPQQAKALISTADSRNWTELPISDDLIMSTPAKNKSNVDILNALPGFLPEKHQTIYSAVQNDD